MQRCLIIDQFEIIRKVAAVILRDFGFQTFEAATAMEGLALFHQQKPVLAIVDANVPDMPALEILRQMHAAKSERTQLLYCTMEFEFFALQRAFGAGATDVLIKPFDRGALVAKLDTWTRAQQAGFVPWLDNDLPRSCLARPYAA